MHNIASPARFTLPSDTNNEAVGMLDTASAALAAGGFPGASAQFANSSQAGGIECPLAVWLRRKPLGALPWM